MKPEITLLPRPKRIETGLGLLPKDVSFYCRFSPNLTQQAKRNLFLSLSAISPDFGVDIPEGNSVVPVDIQLLNKDDFIRQSKLTELQSIPEEAYILDIGDLSISIQAQHERGLYSAIHTLQQLWKDGGNVTLPHVRIVDYPKRKMRGAHFCYHLVDRTRPYSAPNFETLMLNIDELASYQINTLLLELELLFPYEKHRRLSSDLAFTREQLGLLVEKTAQYGIELIPIVQCLGHAYNVLQFDEYKHLRELPDKIQQYCPCNPKVVSFYEELVDEYLEVFPDLKYFHIGGDESRVLGECPRCKDKVEQFGISRLYVDHINEIARVLLKKNIQPIVWTDMIEHYPESIAHLPPELILMCWYYHPVKWSRPFKGDLLRSLKNRIIAAPAIKFGSSGNIAVDYNLAIEGMAFLDKHSESISKEGLIVTNWMKNIPHDFSMYGYAYAAEAAWSGIPDLKDFQRRFVKRHFGCDQQQVAEVYHMLSANVSFEKFKQDSGNRPHAEKSDDLIEKYHWSGFLMPFAEDVQEHYPDRLNRLDHSGFSIEEKINKYILCATDAEKRDYLAQMQSNLKQGKKALTVIWQYLRSIKKNQNEWGLLELAASALVYKSRLGIALMHVLGSNSGKLDGAICDELEELFEQHSELKEKMRTALAKTHFNELADIVTEFKFPKPEQEVLAQLLHKAGRIPKKEMAVHQALR